MGRISKFAAPPVDEEAIRLALLSDGPPNKINRKILVDGRRRRVADRGAENGNLNAAPSPFGWPLNWA